MSDKAVVMLGFTIGSLIGGYIPILWGASFLSYSSIIGNAVGGIVGIYLSYKFVNG
jgi:hypothetical protein